MQQQQSTKIFYYDDDDDDDDLDHASRDYCDEATPYRYE